MLSTSDFGPPIRRLGATSPSAPRGKTSTARSPDSTITSSCCRSTYNVSGRDEGKHERGVIAVVRNPDFAVLQVVGDAHGSDDPGPRSFDDADRCDVAGVGAAEDPDRAVAVVGDDDLVARAIDVDRHRP